MDLLALTSMNDGQFRRLLQFVRPSYGNVTYPQKPLYSLSACARIVCRLFIPLPSYELALSIMYILTTRIPAD